MGSILLRSVSCACRDARNRSSAQHTPAASLHLPLSTTRLSLLSHHHLSLGIEDLNKANEEKRKEEAEVAKLSQWQRRKKAINDAAARRVEAVRQATVKKQKAADGIVEIQKDVGMSAGRKGLRTLTLCKKNINFAFTYWEP